MNENVVTTIRINKDILEKIKTYAEIEGMTQTDLINDLLKEAFEIYFLQRSGGAVLQLPNPQLFSINAINADAILDEVRSFFRMLKDKNMNYPIPIHSILAFFEQRVFLEQPEEAERFRSNMIMDGTQSGFTTAKIDKKV